MKMTKLGAEYVVAYPKLFNQYEQDMVKSINFQIIITICMKDGMNAGRSNITIIREENGLKIYIS